MRRVLFSWSGFNIYSYPAMLYLGMVAGVFAGAHAAHLSGMNPNKFAAASVLLIVPALVGSRLFFVFTHWDLYRGHLSRIWRRSTPTPNPSPAEVGSTRFRRVLSAEPGQARVRWGGEPTEYAAMTCPKQKRTRSSSMT
jgi:hypothetical protein